MAEGVGGPHKAPSDPAGEKPVFCLRCGYDLRTVDPSGVCPECGLELRDTLRMGGIARVGPELRARLTWGARLFQLALWGVLAWLLGVVLTPFVLLLEWVVRGSPAAARWAILEIMQVVGSVTLALIFATWLVGAWALSIGMPGEGEPGDWPPGPDRARWLNRPRTLGVLALATEALAVAVCVLMWSVPPLGVAGAATLWQWVLAVLIAAAGVLTLLTGVAIERRLMAITVRLGLGGLGSRLFRLALYGAAAFGVLSLLAFMFGELAPGHVMPYSHHGSRTMALRSGVLACAFAAVSLVPFQRLHRRMHHVREVLRLRG